MALYISYPYVMKLVAEARKELKKVYDEYDYENDKSVKDRARGLHALRELGRELQKRMTKSIKNSCFMPTFVLKILEASFCILLVI